MLSSQSLLVEIGTEELPPCDLEKLSTSFKNNFYHILKKQQLTFKDIEAFATPRRIGLHVIGLIRQQPEQMQSRRGPTIKTAFDKQGNPTKAALGFMRNCGISVAQLTKKKAGKEVYLFHEEMLQGRRTEIMLPEILKEALCNLPISKQMRWGNLSESFVRPVQWIVLFFGQRSIKTTLFGITSGQYTYGHRFHYPNKILIESPKNYESILEIKGKVIPSFAKRKEMIIKGINEVAKEVHGKPNIDKRLLNLVTGLVEYPVPLLGVFSDKFLSIPKEVLLFSMQKHQKCFPIVDFGGKLLPYFILISNIDSFHPDQVVLGNERVMHARLADADFFFSIDKKQKLISHLDALKQVVFQQKLGSLYDKLHRVKQLAVFIANQIGAHLEHTARIAILSKMDLMTKMVCEFPELQGIMGYYYAKHDGELESIATGIREHYLPRFAADTLPLSLPGVCVALADRIDSVVGLFGIDKAPTGDKDPFGLRRNILAILRIMIEKELKLNLQSLIEESYCLYNNCLIIDLKTLLLELHTFWLDRLNVLYISQKSSQKTVETVVKKKPSSPCDFNERFKAIKEFYNMPESEGLISANKRVANFLSKLHVISQGNLDLKSAINTSLLQEPAEKALYEVLYRQFKLITQDNNKYSEILKRLATVKNSVDAFFCDVMVMSKDENLRNNRLILLNQLQKLFCQVVDVSLL